jgi:2-iminobutanoate/2-iminopropanoate deaminase
MTKRIIQSSGAPVPVASYSQAVQAGDLVFCSGQIPLDPLTKALVLGDIGAQTVRVLENLGAVLAEVGLDHSDIVKCTVFLADMADFPAFDAAYAPFFPKGPPARATVAVAGLPRGARIEIDAIAMLRT